MFSLRRNSKLSPNEPLFIDNAIIAYKREDALVSWLKVNSHRGIEHFADDYWSFTRDYA